MTSRPGAGPGDPPGEAGADGQPARSRRKRAEDIFDALYRRIVDRELAPGDKLPSERELMARFDVGRPAVREAMQSLASRGLISISQGERARVVHPTADGILRQIDGAVRQLLSGSPADLEYLKQARLLFETAVTGAAAACATPEDIERLRAAFERQRASIGDGSAFVRADMGFHATIASITGNPILAAVSEATLDWLAQFHIELLRKSGREQVTLDEHAEILERIAAHDPEGAVRVMTEHLNRSRSLYRLPAGDADG